MERGTAARSRWARIAAFISSRCDSSSTAHRVRRTGRASSRRLAAMCFDLDSEPPIPRISGAAVSHDDLTLESEDGNRFAAFRAVPDGDLAAGVVILPDVRGLYRFYEELALRFAERGIAAVAIDYFGRTAGVGKRDDDFPYMDHVAQTTEAGVQDDIAAATAFLREAEPRSIFTVGFCFGGRLSWLAAAGGHSLAGAVGFYGASGDREGWVGAASRAADMTAPILALQAGDDPNIPPEMNEAFDDALTAADVEHEIVTYEGPPHSFFDRKQEQHQAASDDAWTRTLAFIERHA